MNTYIMPTNKTMEPASDCQREILGKKLKKIVRMSEEVKKRSTQKKAGALRLTIVPSAAAHARARPSISKVHQAIWLTLKGQQRGKPVIALACARLTCAGADWRSWILVYGEDANQIATA
jgi:hypothetical protein